MLSSTARLATPSVESRKPSARRGTPSELLGWLSASSDSTSNLQNVKNGKSAHRAILRTCQLDHLAGRRRPGGAPEQRTGSPALYRSNPWSRPRRGASTDEATNAAVLSRRSRSTSANVVNSCESGAPALSRTPCRGG